MSSHDILIFAVGFNMGCWLMFLYKVTNGGKNVYFEANFKDPK
jgi:hypothetical protein